MLKPLLQVIFVLSASACDAICSQAAADSAGPPVVFVEEDLEYEARQAGFRDGELRELVITTLESEGVTIASDVAIANITVDIDLLLLDPGTGGYAGLARLAVREPATLWANGAGVRVITTAQEFVFTAPKADVREYVGGNLQDYVRKLVASNERLLR